MLRKMLLRVVVLLSLALSALATTFDECPNGETPPVELRVFNCTEPPCNFVRGKDISAEVDFVPDHEITRMKPHVQAVVLGLAVNYTLPQRNACKSLIDQECPLPKGEKATYLLKLPILSVYPPVQLTVKLSLVDSITKQIITCFKINGQVV